ncbi:translation machinery-associated protein 16 homolog isoform X2 [Bombus vosnesenskii]|uniref:Translation machinery-associated protein 16 homolog isoform X2 n=1 Tax=Bombus vosnesenskii TaxID=207650 RepID=A0A6J3LA13_9HYME|nr:translation machinery-associated protein 16 homolog isoform X2 [Bombus vosnesenskii]
MTLYSRDNCKFVRNGVLYLIQRYVARNDEEMEEITIKRSIGSNRSRQHARREHIIRVERTRRISYTWNRNF